MTDSDTPAVSPEAALEALLFVSGEPLPTAKIAAYLGIGRDACVDLLQQYRAHLDADSERGLTLMENGGVVMLLTKPQTARFVERLTTEALRENLSRAALEVLTIIAYRGPVSRPSIDLIRGVNSSYTIRNLLLRGLIEREETALGRGYHYAVSTRFFQILGIGSLVDLPDYQDFHKDPAIGAAMATAEEKKTEETEGAE